MFLILFHFFFSSSIFYIYYRLELEKIQLISSKSKKEILYICPKCKTKEIIPAEIVEMLNRTDQIEVMEQVYEYKEN